MAIYGTAMANYVIYKNDAVFANVEAASSKVDGMGTRLIDDAGEVVFHSQDSSYVIVKGAKVKVGTAVE
jgi:hypothetical protein